MKSQSMLLIVLIMYQIHINLSHPAGVHGFCENNGFDRLFEVKSLEDSQFTNKLEFCK